MFRKATKKKLRARIALDGPAGSGKTYTALRFAFALAQAGGGRVAVIDTEHRSASKYQGEAPDGTPWDFDVCELEHYAPSTYTQVLRAAGAEGYDVVVIDSLSHAWEGVGGALDQVDKKGGNSFTAWKDVTPQHREMIEAILGCPCHVIATMRTKTEYVLEEQTNKQGKTVQVPRKIGMAPIQRAGMEYEFDVVCDLDLSHTLTVSKSRCSALDGKKAVSPGAPFVAPLLTWLGSGVDAPAEELAAPKFEKPQQTAETQPAEQSGGGVKLSGQRKVDPRNMKATDPCGEEFAGLIKQAAQAVDLPREKLVAILSRHGVARLADLPLKEADKLRAKLEAMALEKSVPF